MGGWLGVSLFICTIKLHKNMLACVCVRACVFAAG